MLREEQEKHVRHLPAPLRGLDYLVGQVLADDSQAEKVLEAASHPPLLLVLAVDWHPPDTAALPSAMRKAGWAKGIGNRVWSLRQVPPEFVDRVCETAHDFIQRLHNFTVSTSKRGLSEQQRSIAPSRKSPPLTEEPGVRQQLAARAAAVQARLRRQNLPALAHNRLEIVQLLPVLICA